MSILGICAGAIDVANTVTILNIWKEKSNPFMQGLHFSFSIGMVISPMLAAPFLEREDNLKDNLNSTTTMSSFNDDVTGQPSSQSDNYTLITLSNNIASVTLLPNDEVSFFEKFYLLTPFAICSGILFLSAIVGMILSIVIRESVPGSSTEKLKEEETSTENIKLVGKSSIVMVVAGCLLISFYNVCEMNSFVYAPTYVEYLGYNREMGAHMAFIMSTAFSIARLCSIAIATKLTTLSMLYIHLSMITVGNIIILLIGKISIVGLAIGLCVLGSGLSAVFPAVYAFFEELMDVTNGVCGIFMFASSLSVSVTPIFEGKFLPSNPSVYAYINLAALGLCFIILCSIHMKFKR